MTSSGRGGRNEPDDRDAVDRAFAELIAGYHLTAEPRQPAAREADLDTRDPDRKDPGSPDLGGDDRAVEDPGRGCAQDTGLETGRETDRGTGGAGPRIDLDSRWADQHPLFSFTEPPAAPDPEPAEERFEPPPPPPWPRPSAAVLVGWLGLGFAVVIMVAAALGVTVPRGLAWTAIGTFVGGFALLLSRLPRHRPPSSGDGAVL